MPCILKLRVVEARSLPVMDRATELADAFVEVHFAENEPQKTHIERRSLNPIWNCDFRFEVSKDSTLQDEPLELKVWDYDIVSANDIIGVVCVDLNSLLSRDAPQLISGWFPIYDTHRGIRGQLFLTAKLEFFLNVNPFKDASAGVQFFSIDTPLSNYKITHIVGFVSELIVDEDPEYMWVDTFRTSRISNTERQLLFYRLSGKLRRQLGCKVLDMGGNAIIGYRQQYDLEGNTGIVARGYGTAVRLKRIRYDSSTDSKPSTPVNITHNEEILEEIGLLAAPQGAPSPDVHLLTVGILQSNMITNIGGVVSARSIKLLSSARKSAATQTRDYWWAEIRGEVKAHARALGCMFVIGYEETTTIQLSEELCVLSATGTAVQLSILRSLSPTNTTNISALPQSPPVSLNQTISGITTKALKLTASVAGVNTNNNWKENDDLESNETEKGKNVVKQKSKPPSLSGSFEEPASGWQEYEKKREARKLSTSETHLHLPSHKRSCHIVHIPYKQAEAPFPMRLVRCLVCSRRYVPEMLLTTIEVPAGLPLKGKGVFVEARVARVKKKIPAEANATLVSEALPFLEYDLHRQLTFKLKVLGMNAVFGLRVAITVGDNLIVGVASATAVFITALPPPPILHINRNTETIDDEDKKYVAMQHKIENLSKQNAHNLLFAESVEHPNVLSKYYSDHLSNNFPPPPFLQIPSSNNISNNNNNNNNNSSNINPSASNNLMNRFESEPNPTNHSTQLISPRLSTYAVLESPRDPDHEKLKSEGDGDDNDQDKKRDSKERKKSEHKIRREKSSRRRREAGKEREKNKTPSEPTFSNMQTSDPLTTSTSASAPFKKPTAEELFSTKSVTPEQRSPATSPLTLPLDHPPVSSPPSTHPTNTLTREPTPATLSDLLPIAVTSTKPPLALDLRKAVEMPLKREERKKKQKKSSGSGSTLSDSSSTSGTRKISRRHRRNKHGSSSTSSSTYSSDSSGWETSNSSSSDYKTNRRRRRIKNNTSGPSSDSSSSAFSSEIEDQISKRRQRVKKTDSKKSAKNDSEKDIHTDENEDKDKDKGKEKVNDGDDSDKDDRSQKSKKGSSATRTRPRKGSSGSSNSSKPKTKDEISNGPNEDPKAYNKNLGKLLHENEEESSTDVSEFPEKMPPSMTGAYIVEVDDELDEDTMAVLLDPILPSGFSLCNTQSMPGNISKLVSNVQLASVVRRLEWDISSGHLTQKLSAVFHHLYLSLMFKLRHLSPCLICALKVDISLPKDDEIQLLLSAMVVTQEVVSRSNSPYLPTQLTPFSAENLNNNTPSGSGAQNVQRSVASVSSKPTRISNEQLDSPHKNVNPIPPHIYNNNNPIMVDSNDVAEPSPPNSPINHSVSFDSIFTQTHNNHNIANSDPEKNIIELTPLSYLPGMRMERYLGRVNIHLIKESFSVKDSGGLGTFTHVFLTETHAIIRAHINAVGGNALVGYTIENFSILQDANKDQAYSMISISGDAFLVRKASFS